MTTHVAEERAQGGAYDPLDLQLDRLGVTGADDERPPSGRRAARGWSSAVQGMVLLLVGAVLGRHGLAILGDSTLSLLDPVVPVALAALGVLVAFEIGAAPWNRGRVLVAASIQSVIAGGVVTAGTLALAPLVTDQAAADWWGLAVTLGICASTSSALAGAATTRSGVARVVDMDAMLPIIAGGLAMAAMREQALPPALSMTAAVTGIALTVATAGWLLLTRTRSETEQRVFSVATLLLLGGVADYLSVSALLSGLVAGGFWHVMGGVVRESIRRDVAHVHHPLVALILIVAGARTELSPAIAALAIAYIVLRAVGKLAGSIPASAISQTPSSDLAPRLLSPGILGVAFALNATRAAGSDVAVVLSIAVLGTIGCQLLAGGRLPEDVA